MMFLRPTLSIRPILALLAIILFCAPISAAPLVHAQLSSENPLTEKRETYKKAYTALRKGQMVDYRSYRNDLYGYPLESHLDYYELERRLSRLPNAEVSAFIAEYEGSYIGTRMHKRWLYTLAKKHRWSSYVKHYDASLSNVDLACHNLNARLQTGDKSALRDVSKFWNVEYSQPKECDPAFKQWIDQGQLSDQVAWERFHKTLLAGNTTLARYLKRFLSDADLRYADLALNLRSDPHSIKQSRQYREQSGRMKQVISYGIKRYARKDAPDALKKWHGYDAQQLFSDELRGSTQEYLLSQLIRQKHHNTANEWLAGMPGFSSEKLVESTIRNALRQGDWRGVLTNIEHLNEESQAQSRWRYWRARSMAALKHDDLTVIESIYIDLAQERSYYGFLASDLLKRQYSLGDNPAAADPEAIKKVLKLPAATRARELLAVGDLNIARQEWLSVTRSLDEQGHLAAAQLTHQWGWYRKTIQALAAVEYWDDLQLRFPLAYGQEVLKIATQQKVSPPLLFAIARQESAFAADARSPAGAMGLMQLLPSTAKYTARKAGVNYKSKYDLLTPEKNITLGSHYINELLTQFDGNRILASAAYNAGPHRVKQWLADTDKQLAHDIWVETIPFNETRKYVQNILAYSVIYGYRMGKSVPLLTPQEKSQKL
jgi:soluble lytic murein transglycosylase